MGSAGTAVGLIDGRAAVEETRFAGCDVTNLPIVNQSIRAHRSGLALHDGPRVEVYDERLNPHSDNSTGDDGSDDPVARFARGTYARVVSSVNNVERVKYVKFGPETDVNLGAIEFYRRTFLSKCEGLSDEQLQRRPIASSMMSLLGLLRHLTNVEQYWFQICLDKRNVVPVYTETDPDGDFNDLESITVEGAVARYHEMCELSRTIAPTHSFDEVVYSDAFESDLTYRFITVHLVDEYARHCGHADLIRELIDGATGH